MGGGFGNGGGGIGGSGGIGGGVLAKALVCLTDKVLVLNMQQSLYVLQIVNEKGLILMNMYNNILC